jgi:hypothetical protein
MRASVPGVAAAVAAGIVVPLVAFVSVGLVIVPLLPCVGMGVVYVEMPLLAVLAAGVTLAVFDEGRFAGGAVAGLGGLAALAALGFAWLALGPVTGRGRVRCGPRPPTTRSGTSRGLARRWRTWLFDIKDQGMLLVGTRETANASEGFAEVGPRLVNDTSNATFELEVHHALNTTSTADDYADLSEDVDRERERLDLVFEALLAAFEDATGYSHVDEVRWQPGVVQT